MGYSLDSDDSNRITYAHVKKVAVIGAGVAGLQLAERLGKKSGLEVGTHCNSAHATAHTTPPTRATAHAESARVCGAR